MDMDIKDTVHKIVHYFDTRNPFEIINAMGAILVRHPLEGVRGFYQFYRRNSIIYVDVNLPKKESQIVSAHELGHLFLHKTSNALFMDTRTQFNTHKYEIEANTFAMELLVPDEIILENIYSTTEQLSRLLDYEQKLIELRLESFRKI